MALNVLQMVYNEALSRLQPNNAEEEELDEVNQAIDKLKVKLASAISEALSRILINAILLRVAIMFEETESQLVVFPKFPVPDTNITPVKIGAADISVKNIRLFSASGSVDYVCALTPKTKLPLPVLLFHRDPHKSIIVIEAKASSEAHCLETHLPQAILRAIAIAKRYKIENIRSVLTTGKDWLFFSLHRSLKTGHGEYSSSLPISTTSVGKEEAIIDLLREWIEASPETLQSTTK
ncbi:hypothetical protein BC834DRAFT_975123 [Gloeopeniophorella convolvens]|nr:hypothetical protein BC834DRAFT_975123 [Gloeopeniophorella convolvens]